MDTEVYNGKLFRSLIFVMSDIGSAEEPSEIISRDVSREVPASDDVVNTITAEVESSSVEEKSAQIPESAPLLVVEEPVVIETVTVTDDAIQDIVVTVTDDTR
ncbi:hypothetical protein HDU99_010317, partial [Rhizoclosmatium hyalinum]